MNKCYLLIFFLIKIYLCEDKNVTNFVVKNIDRCGPAMVDAFYVCRIDLADIDNDLTLPVKWDAFKYEFPNLPNWLHLAWKDFRYDAYFYGQPGKTDVSTNITVMVSKDENFVRKFANFLIVIDKSDVSNETDDTEILEIVIKNHDSHDFLNEPRLLENLKHRITTAFSVKSPLLNLKPTEIFSTDARREGVQVIITPRENLEGFSSGARFLALGIRQFPDGCDNSSSIVFNKDFVPDFTINWCRILLRTRNKPAKPGRSMLSSDRLYSIIPPGKQYMQSHPATNFQSRKLSKLQREYFLDWFLLVAVPLVILIIVLLLLSAIFFGCREGQHWRDYKTPQPQLIEYVSLLRGQAKLRQMSNQRATMHVGDFEREPIIDKKPAKLPRKSSITDRGHPPTLQLSKPSTPLGRQTVYQAATKKGSRMELYASDAGENDPFISRTLSRAESERAAELDIGDGGPPETQTLGRPIRRKIPDDELRDTSL